jgi:hypothetical protein
MVAASPALEARSPLTGLSDDVAATKRVIDQQDGPVILVGHSHGGTIITVAGADPLYLSARRGRQRHRQGGPLHRTEYDEPLDDARAPHDHLETTACSLAKEMRLFEEDDV